MNITGIERADKRIRNNKRRRQKEMRRHFLISICMICITVFLAFGFFSIQTKAKDASETIEIKYYTSIAVSSGDTLWSIASEYKGIYYASEADYIKEVKRINSLKNETIYAGQHLVIPYYSNEMLK